MCILSLNSSTINYQDNYKLIRYTKMIDGFVSIEYQNGILKKQVKRKQISAFSLPFSEKKDIEYFLNNENIKELVNIINKSHDSSKTELPSTMYLFIKGTDTLKTEFVNPIDLPIKFKKIDYIISRKRSF